MIGVSWTASWRLPRFDGASAQAARGAVAGLEQAAVHLRGQANRTVPIEEGTLQRSGGVDVDPAALEASVYYDTPYAAVQHEDTSLAHDPGRRAKWLELTLAERNRELRDLIAKGISGQLR